MNFQFLLSLDLNKDPSASSENKTKPAIDGEQQVDRKA
jgi:hypothetical protein